MSGLITAAVIAGGTAVAAAGVSAYGSAQSSKAARAAGEMSSARLTALGYELFDMKNALAEEVDKRYGKLSGKYEDQSNGIINRLKFTDARGLLQKGPNGTSYFDDTLIEYNEADTSRRKSVLGGAENDLRQATQIMARIATGDTEPIAALMRASEASIAANTRGAAIGYGADLGAKVRFGFMQSGSETATRLVNTLSSFYTPTATVFESALRVSDEQRREAARKDESALQKATMKINSLQYATGIISTGLQTSFGLKSGAISTYGEAMSAASNALSGGQRDAANYDAQVYGSIAQGISAAGSAYSGYASAAKLGSAQSSALANQRAAVTIQGYQAGLSQEQINGLYGGDVPSGGFTSNVQQRTVAPYDASSYNAVRKVLNQGGSSPPASSTYRVELPAGQSAPDPSLLMPYTTTPIDTSETELTGGAGMRPAWWTNSGTGPTEGEVSRLSQAFPPLH